MSRRGRRTKTDGLDGQVASLARKKGWKLNVGDLDGFQGGRRSKRTRRDEHCHFMRLVRQAARVRRSRSGVEKSMVVRLVGNRGSVLESNANTRKREKVFPGCVTKCGEGKVEKYRERLTKAGGAKRRGTSKGKGAGGTRPKDAQKSPQGGVS